MTVSWLLLALAALDHNEKCVAFQMLVWPSFLKTRKPFHSHVSDPRAPHIITTHIPIGALDHHDRGRSLQPFVPTMPTRSSLPPAWVPVRWSRDREFGNLPIGTKDDFDRPMTAFENRARIRSRIRVWVIT